MSTSSQTSVTRQKQFTKQVSHVQRENIKLEEVVRSNWQLGKASCRAKMTCSQHTNAYDEGCGFYRWQGPTSSGGLRDCESLLYPSALLLNKKKIMCRTRSVYVYTHLIRRLALRKRKLKIFLRVTSLSCNNEVNLSILSFLWKR